MMGTLDWSKVIDTHCHISNKANARLPPIKANKLLVMGTSLQQDWKIIQQLYKNHPDQIVPCYGIHPWESSTSHKQMIPLLKSLLLSTPSPKVLGEIGLDTIAKNPITNQKYDFTQQLDLFLQQFLLGLEIGVDGISMHAVGCHGLVVDLLREIDWLVAYNLGKKKKMKEFKFFCIGHEEGAEEIDDQETILQDHEDMFFQIPLQQQPKTCIKKCSDSPCEHKYLFPSSIRSIPNICLHSFTGSRETITGLAALKYARVYFSTSATVHSGKNWDERIGRIPVDRLLVESDGQVDVSAVDEDLEGVLRECVKVVGKGLDEVVDMVYSNSLKFLGQ